ncbi:class I SAM-dependent methyltransferase family protein, partial [Candidatus Woesearchaeota archaeon]|nr:class I SAM-dependent methyltransferase family protein [Candidatus Woesearchaeota archaeon]
MLFCKKKSLSPEDIKKIPKSFEIVGSILIFSNFPNELNKKLVGNYLLNKLKNIKTVAIKSKFYSGKYRTPKLKIIAGIKSKETIHRENGILLKVNPEEVYFSARTSTERLRIAKLVKKDESVLVMFSGAAPFPLVISKHSKAKEIYGIEINSLGHKYAQENVKLNKLNNIKLFQGDVNKVLPILNKNFDRIIMPLPKNSEEYLDLA